MNISKSIFSLLLCCTFFACTNNTENLVTEETLEIQSKASKSKIGPLLGGPLSSEITDFDNQLQWSSYIAARVVLGNQQAREEVYTKLNGENVISLNDLIGRQVGFDSPFKSGFYALLRQYILLDVDFSSIPRVNPVHGNQSPPRPIPTKVSDSGSSAFGVPVSSFVDFLVTAFVADMVDNNCLELYFPKGFSLEPFSNSTSIVVSSAHPLIQEGFNVGYLQTARPLSGSNEISSTSILVNDQLLANSSLENIIIIRPYRELNLEESCTYPDYVEDFTIFMRP
ncbi:hypothetical protein [Tenacibaculum sp. M341]|uniref:hypothetical protein n=1 Tax=Tenacibaculum sp. M341 TaxID=2530339 RepID=UPI00104F5D74|nr:hypothetical protein [Tenacibaculum sp. M341]TCI94860.1 hypothetical protein EYW44_00630 [Tenacibaculum sp. M341]